jgi:hypothetical protein
MKEGLRYYYSSDAKWMFKLPPSRDGRKKEDMCVCPGTGSSRFTQAHSRRILFLYFFPSVSREGLDFFSSSSCEKFRRHRRSNIRCIHFHTLLLPPPKSLFRDPAGIKKKGFFLAGEKTKSGHVPIPFRHTNINYNSCFWREI